MRTVREVAEEFARRLEQGDLGHAFELMNEQGTYTIIGTTPLSKTTKGRAAIMAAVTPAAGAHEFLPTLHFPDVIVEGDRAVILGSGHGKGVTGPYHQPYYCFVTRVRDGGFDDMIEFADTVMVETAFFGKKLVDA